MSTTPLAVESERLRAIATLNGRVRSNLFLYRREDETTPLLAEDLNLADSEHRTALVGCLDEEYRAEATPLLARLAAVVAAERAKPKKATATEAGPFPQLDPWETAVSGAALLDSIRDHILAYVVLPAHAADALALWIAHTYLTDVADYTPYILVTSPVRECGKSTLLELLQHLAYRALLTGGITAAALYRRIERYGPTMLLDELDTRLRGDAGEALRGVLNTGFQRSGSVTVCVGDAHEDRDFKTFCPKVLAGIGRVWDTVTSRSIPIRLARASRDQLDGLKRIRGDQIDGLCLPFRRQLVRWACDVRDQLVVTDPETPRALGARQTDVWRPLLAIADAVGGHWPETARAAAIALHGVAEEEGDYGLLILEDLRDLFRTRGADVLFTAAILQVLGQREDRPWPEYRGDRAITARGLSQLVGRFGVKPKTVRDGAETGKGYTLADLAPVFKTYLPAPAEPVPASPETVVTDVTDRNEVCGHEEILEREAIQAEGAGW